MASSLEGNKIAAAVLTAGIIAMGAGVFSDILYGPEELDEPVIAIAMPDDDAAPVAEEVVQPLPVLLAAASVDSGANVAKKCAACHVFEEGGANKVGPHLWEVVGRDIAAVGDFAYSEALAALEGAWTFEALDGFLQAPKEWAPGTKMAFAGLSDPEDRADMILYMRSMASDPVALPEVEASEEAASQTEAAETEAAVEAETTAETEAAAEAETTAETEAAAEAETTAETTAAAAAETTTDAPAGDAAADASQGAPAGATSEGTTVAAATETEAADAGAAEAGGAELTGVLAMLASADAEAGQKVARKCAACHTFEKDGPNRVGPNLWGIVDRPVGTHEGFNYSEAVKDYGGEWSWSSLDSYLADPRGYIPGNKMAFAGIKKEDERADLLVYLRSLSDEPAPLP